MAAHFADVDSVWVKCNSGVAYCVLLTKKDGSTSELRGAKMRSWLVEWSRLCAARKTTSRANSLLTSKGYVRNDRQAHFAWDDS